MYLANYGREEHWWVGENVGVLSDSQNTLQILIGFSRFFAFFAVRIRRKALENINRILMKATYIETQKEFSMEPWSSVYPTHVGCEVPRAHTDGVCCKMSRTRNYLSRFGLKNLWTYFVQNKNREETRSAGKFENDLKGFCFKMRGEFDLFG